MTLSMAHTLSVAPSPRSAEARIGMSSIRVVSTAVVPLLWPQGLFGRPGGLMA